MKVFFVTIFMLVGSVAFASNDYPLTAHIVGSAKIGPPFWCKYDVRIGKLEYIAQKRFSCDASLSGVDLSARIEKNKLVLQLPDGKALKLDIVGSGE